MKISLTFKFFLNLLTAIGFVTAAMFFLMQYSFDRGFLNFVNKVEIKRLGALSVFLEKEYSKQQNWRFLQGNFRLWGKLLQDSRTDDLTREPIPHFKGPGGPVDFPETMPGMQNRQSPHHHPPEIKHLFEHRVVLMDAKRHRILGPPYSPENVQIKALRYKNEVRGYLALIPQENLTENLHLRYVKEQKRTFGIIALLTAFIASLLSLPLARHMVKRIKSLTSATHRLNAGNYSYRLPVDAEDELGQLIKDFNMLANTLEQNEKIRQQWIGDISHELRTPLAVLRGEIEAMLDRVRQATPEALNSLHTEVMRLERLVDDLFQLSMSDIGALTYRKKNLDLVDLIEESLGSFIKKFSDKKISVAIELPEKGKVIVFGDPDRLKQLFENLFNNSFRYTDQGGQLKIEMELSDTTVKILIEDSEPGVLPDEITKLFDRLYRVESSRNRALGGTGLGLAICRNIVEAHEGTITALTSKLGGIMIKIVLPLAGNKHE